MTLPLTEIMRDVVRQEADGLAALAKTMDENWTRAVLALDGVRRSGGRAIVSGVGKSGHVGRKIAATLASTGTPAFFLHGTEASHGDLGMIAPGDAVVMLSASGSTREMRDVAAACRDRGVALVLITRNASGELAAHADHVLLLPDLPEADPNGLAPTVSSTQTLAAGDALAIALMRLAGFTRADFGRHHPGGKLGIEARGGN